MRSIVMCQSDCVFHLFLSLLIHHQLCELRNSNNCVFFEMRKKMDMFMWYVVCHR